MSGNTTFIASRTTIFLVQTSAYQDDLEIEDISMSVDEMAEADRRSPAILVEDVTVDGQDWRGKTLDERQVSTHHEDILSPILALADASVHNQDKQTPQRMPSTRRKRPYPPASPSHSAHTRHSASKRARRHSPTPSKSSSRPIPLDDATCTQPEEVNTYQGKNGFFCPVVTCSKFYHNPGAMARHLSSGACRLALGITGRVVAANVMSYLDVTVDEGQTADALVAMFENEVAQRDPVRSVSAPVNKAEPSRSGVGYENFIWNDDDEELTDLSDEEDGSNDVRQHTQLREAWVAQQGEDRSIVFSILPSLQSIGRHNRAYNIIDADHLVFEGTNRCTSCQARNCPRPLAGRPIFGCCLMLENGAPMGTCACCAITGLACKWEDSTASNDQAWTEHAARTVARYVKPGRELRVGCLELEATSSSRGRAEAIQDRLVTSASVDAVRGGGSGVDSADDHSRRSTRSTRKQPSAKSTKLSRSPDPIQLSDDSESYGPETGAKEKLKGQEVCERGGVDAGGRATIMAKRDDDDEAVVQQLRDDDHPALARKYSQAYSILHGKHCVMEGSSRCRACIRIDFSLYRGTAAPHFECILEVTKDGVATGMCLRCLSRGSPCTFGSGNHPKTWLDKVEIVDAMENLKALPDRIPSTVEPEKNGRPGVLPASGIVGQGQAPNRVPIQRPYSGSTAGIASTHLQEDALKRISARAGSLLTKLTKVEVDDLFYNEVIIDLHNQATFWHQGNGTASARFARQAPIMKDRLFAALDASVAVIEAEAGSSKLCGEWEDVVQALDSLVQLLKRSSL